MKSKLLKLSILFFVVFYCSCSIVTLSSKQMRFGLAAVKGDVALVKRIYNSGGIDINAMNGKVGPALTSASYGGHKEIVLFLLENGADINVRDSNGATPLMNAVIGEKLEIARVLLEKGAETGLPGLPISNDKDGNMITAMTYAKVKQNKEMIELLATWDASHKK